MSTKLDNHKISKLTLCMWTYKLHKSDLPLYISKYKSKIILHIYLWYYCDWDQYTSHTYIFLLLKFLDIFLGFLLRLFQSLSFLLLQTTMQYKYHYNICFELSNLHVCLLMNSLLHWTIVNIHFCIRKKNPMDVLVKHRCPQQQRSQNIAKSLQVKGVTIQEKRTAVYCDIFSLYCDILFTLYFFSKIHLISQKVS